MVKNVWEKNKLVKGNAIHASACLLFSLLRVLTYVCKSPNFIVIFKKIFQLNWKFLFIFNRTHLISDKTIFIWQLYTKIRPACLFTHTVYIKDHYTAAPHPSLSTVCSVMWWMNKLYYTAKTWVNRDAKYTTKFTFIPLQLEAIYF